MPRNVKDRTKEKYGRLQPIDFFFVENKRGKNIVWWNCICDCGNKKSVRGIDLGRGINSCGCIAVETNREKARNNITHGMTNTRFYKKWRSMHDRCNNEKHKSYIYYGGRGIAVDERWSKFENFMEDMHESYLKHCEAHGERNTTIERIDYNGNYCKDNCTWKTPKEQAQNRR